MKAGIKAIVGGIAALALGCLLAAAPPEMNLRWYHPLPAFVLAPILIAMGVYVLKRDGQDTVPVETTTEDETE